MCVVFYFITCLIQRTNMYIKQICKLLYEITDTICWQQVGNLFSVEGISYHTFSKVKKLKTLRLLIAVEDPDIVLTVRKLGMVSMTEVFKDIIPSYRVRDWAQGEETVKVSHTRHYVARIV